MGGVIERQPRQALHLRNPAGFGMSPQRRNAALKLATADPAFVHHDDQDVGPARDDIAALEERTRGALAAVLGSLDARERQQSLPTQYQTGALQDYAARPVNRTVYWLTTGLAPSLALLCGVLVALVLFLLPLPLHKPDDTLAFGPLSGPANAGIRDATSNPAPADIQPIRTGAPSAPVLTPPPSITPIVVHPPSAVQVRNLPVHAALLRLAPATNGHLAAAPARPAPYASILPSPEVVRPMVDEWTAPLPRPRPAFVHARRKAVPAVRAGRSQAKRAASTPSPQDSTRREARPTALEWYELRYRTDP